jgi:catechol 2,3-dioxygenase-like lactoylglutathione lyase family enzyme
MTRPDVGSISPFFIVRDVATSLAFYRDRLGFEVTFQGFGDDLFFGIVRRGGAMIMLKSVGVDPLPNYRREPRLAGTRISTSLIPTPLAAEFATRHVEFSEPLRDTDDSLRGFELEDADGISCSSAVLVHRREPAWA